MTNPLHDAAMAAKRFHDAALAALDADNLSAAIETERALHRAILRLMENRSEAAYMDRTLIAFDEARK